MITNSQKTQLIGDSLRVSPLSHQDDNDGDERSDYRGLALVALVVVIPLTYWIDPYLIPMGFTDVWSSHGKGFGDWFAVGLPFLACGVGLNIIVQLFGIGSMTDFGWLGRKYSRWDILKNGMIHSIFTGAVEEIAFRWLIFLGSFASLAIGNWLIFGWAGFGVVEWFYMNIWGPVADFTTLGNLEPWLFGKGWLFGAAVLHTNALFRDGHKYQGLLGVLNSWFCGMFLFYVMFTHGLLAAIFLHILYNTLAYVGKLLYSMSG